MDRDECSLTATWKGKNYLSNYLPLTISFYVPFLHFLQTCISQQRVVLPQGLRSPPQFDRAEFYFDMGIIARRPQGDRAWECNRD